MPRTMLTGIICDVSASMKENAYGIGNNQDVKWVRSVFEVIENLIRYDISPENDVFALGVGANFDKGILDILYIIDTVAAHQYKDYRDILDEIFQLLEAGGASLIRQWASKETIMNAIPIEIAVLCLDKIQNSKHFRRYFIKKCLPRFCRDWFDVLGLGSLRCCQSALTNTVTRFRTATENEIFQIVEKATSKLFEDFSVFPVQDASNSIRNCVYEYNSSFEGIEHLVHIIEPWIYGKTPLYKCLNEAIAMFSPRKYSTHDKLLFVLSDGEPTDSGKIEKVLMKLKKENVTVVTCFINASSNVDPLKLYATRNERWNDGAKFMFDLSSSIPTQLLPRTIFVKRNWTIDIKNNETKLFLQVNHPDNIQDACDLATDVVFSQDALADLLVSVSLDIYINQSTSSIKPRSQQGGTCFAHASATVLHLSMKRIIGRKGGYPGFERLRDEMIRDYGIDGANTYTVLKTMCRRYRLQCKRIKTFEALQAISEKRPVVARFRLTEKEWDIFDAFYDDKPTGVLTRNEIDITKRSPGEEDFGHAVVLTSYSSYCLRFMNSYGSEWGDMGFFRVKEADVLNCDFLDVFWECKNLKSGEKKYFKRHGAEVASQLMDRFIGLHQATYKCPLCKEKSFVREFSGKLIKAVCPKCKEIFKTNEDGNVLALNMYLTSLLR